MPSTRYLEYPDLKRLDTVATQLFNMRHPEKEIKQIFWPRFEAEIFTQLWGSTCLAFDVVDGAPAIGGCAMTEAYTVVLHEKTLDEYYVFVDERPVYSVDNPNEAFREDLKNHRLATLSVALKRYES